MFFVAFAVSAKMFLHNFFHTILLTSNTFYVNFMITLKETWTEKCFFLSHRSPSSSCSSLLGQKCVYCDDDDGRLVGEKNYQVSIKSSSARVDSLMKLMKTLIWFHSGNERKSIINRNSIWLLTSCGNRQSCFPEHIIWFHLGKLRETLSCWCCLEITRFLSHHLRDV